MLASRTDLILPVTPCGYRHPDVPPRTHPAPTTVRYVPTFKTPASPTIGTTSMQWQDQSQGQNELFGSYLLASSSLRSVPYAHVIQSMHQQALRLSHRDQGQGQGQGHSLRERDYPLPFLHPLAKRLFLQERSLYRRELGFQSRLAPLEDALSCREFNKRSSTPDSMDGCCPRYRQPPSENSGVYYAIHPSSAPGFVPDRAAMHACRDKKLSSYGAAASRDFFRKSAFGLGRRTEECSFVCHVDKDQSVHRHRELCPSQLRSSESRKKAAIHSLPCGIQEGSRDLPPEPRPEIYNLTKDAGKLVGRETACNDTTEISPRQHPYTLLSNSVLAETKLHDVVPNESNPASASLKGQQQKPRLGQKRGRRTIPRHKDVPTPSPVGLLSAHDRRPRLKGRYPCTAKRGAVDGGRTQTTSTTTAATVAAADPRSKVFRCGQCRYRTDRKNNLKRHVLTMHQRTARVLECCSTLFASKASLRDHVALFHRGGYRCQVCSRNFCRKALLRRHLTVHSGQKDFACRLCGYATSHKSNLERHQRVHARKAGVYGPQDCLLLRSEDDHGSHQAVDLSPQGSYRDPRLSGLNHPHHKGNMTFSQSKEITSPLSPAENNDSTADSAISPASPLDHDVVVDLSEGDSSSTRQLLQGTRRVLIHDIHTLGEASQEKVSNVPGVVDPDSNPWECNDCPELFTPSSLVAVDVDSTASEGKTWTWADRGNSPDTPTSDPWVSNKKSCFPNRLRETYRYPGTDAVGAADRPQWSPPSTHPWEGKDANDVETKENENPSVRTQNVSSSESGTETDRCSGNELKGNPKRQRETHKGKELCSKRRICCRPYRCFGCSASFSNQEDLRDHKCAENVDHLLHFPVMSCVLKGCIQAASQGNEAK